MNNSKELKINIRNQTIADLGITALILFFLNISLNINLGVDVLYDQSGDGLKNYFTFAYHMKYMNSLNFDGFLYPFGDITTYADSQYPIVLIIQLAEVIGIDLSSHSLVILNLLTISSFIIGGVILRRVFKELGVGFLFQILFASFCMILSPQILRIQSHYALAYPVLLTSVMYLLIKFERTSVIKTQLMILSLMSLLLLVFGLIHAYHLVIAGVFVFSFAVIRAYFTPFSKYFLLALIPVATIAGYLVLFYYIDVETDRPLNPYGLWKYRTSLEDFLPGHGYFGDLVNRRFIPERLEEGYSYLTLLPLLASFILGLQWFRGGLKFFPIAKSLNSLSVSFFLSGVLCLLIACGAHLFIGGERILEILPQLKQFRALGRFSWPFYYSTFILSAVIINSYWNALRSEKSKNIFLVMICIILFWDGYLFHNDFGRFIDTYKSSDLLKNEKSISELLKGRYEADHFQALLPIPASTEGGEKFNMRTNYFLKTRCLPFSYQSGLPMSYSVMSRVSQSKMFKILQLSNSSFGQKKIAKEDFPNAKPLLLVIDNAYVNDYSDILNKAYFINKNEVISLYDLPLDTAIHRSQYVRLEEAVNLSHIKSIAKKDTVMYFNDFVDSNISKGVDNYEGCFFNENGFAVIDEFEIPQLNDEVEIELSFWNKILNDKSNVPVFGIYLMGNKGEVILEDRFRDWDLRRTEVYEDWVRYTRNYSLPKNIHSIKISVDGDYQFVDKLLIKSKNIHVFQALSDNEAFADHMMVEI